MLNLFPGGIIFFVEDQPVKEVLDIYKMELNILKEQPYFQKTFICYLRFHDRCQSSDNRIRNDFKLELIYHLVDFIQKNTIW